MTEVSTIENMGFSEVPNDAFDAFDLPPPVLERSYKTHCMFCNEITYNNVCLSYQFATCRVCEQDRIPVIQKHIRGFLTRRRLNHLRNQELMFRWFHNGGIRGTDLSRHIRSFL